MNAASLRKVLYPIETIMYLVILLIGVFDYFGYASFYSNVQAKTVAINAGFAICLVYLPLLAELVTKKKISPFIDLVICVDLIFSVIAGETFQLYLTLTWWDKFLHFFASAEFALLGYVLAETSLKKLAPGSGKTVFLSMVFAFFFAVACEAIWEVCEFAVDSLAGTNMQKYVPESYYDLIATDGILDMPADEIVAFFSTSEGYTYALRDTMLDIIVDVAGSLFGAVLTCFVFRNKPSLVDSALFLKENGKVAGTGKPGYAVVDGTKDSSGKAENQSSGKNDR